VSPGDSVAIAAHAEVEDGERAEGAWGEGAGFVQGRKWGTYFTYEVQEAGVASPGYASRGSTHSAPRQGWRLPP
jgi:hypothetical protein